MQRQVLRRLHSHCFPVEVDGVEAYVAMAFLALHEVLLVSLVQMMPYLRLDGNRTSGSGEQEVTPFVAITPFVRYFHGKGAVSFLVARAPIHCPAN